MTIPTPPAVPPYSTVPEAAMPALDPRTDAQGPGLPTKPAHSRKHLYFGAGGLVAGLIVGLLLGAVGGAVGDALSASNRIDDSVKACSAEGSEGVTVMDKGRSLDMKSSGGDSTGTSITTVVCILNELGAPESLFSRIDSTRALDGTREAAWDGYTASWTYHPDNGLNIIVESAK
ncbi:hypothetical protein [Arthrobacter livingstonensis]|nr:hypothetical protein [Arthrobacter livingstonensis]